MEWVLVVYLFYSPGHEPIQESVAITTAEFYTKEACELAARDAAAGRVGDNRWPSSYTKCYSKSGPPEVATLTPSARTIVRGFPTGGLVKLTRFTQFITVNVKVGETTVTLRRVNDSAGVGAGQTATVTLVGTGTATLNMVK
jgi:hypothetical protein